MSESNRACESRVQKITQSDLPLACPRQSERVWDAHPRVYLSIEAMDDGAIVCPYCGTEYQLTD